MSTSPLGLVQRLLAVHHPRAGAVAELLYLRSGDRGGAHLGSFSWSSVSSAGAARRPSSSRGCAASWPRASSPGAGSASASAAGASAQPPARPPARRGLRRRASARRGAASAAAPRPRAQAPGRPRRRGLGLGRRGAASAAAPRPRPRRSLGGGRLGLGHRRRLGGGLRLGRSLSLGRRRARGTGAARRLPLGSAACGCTCSRAVACSPGPPAGMAGSSAACSAAAASVAPAALGLRTPEVLDGLGDRRLGGVARLALGLRERLGGRGLLGLLARLLLGLAARLLLGLAARLLGGLLARPLLLLAEGAVAGQDHVADRARDDVAGADRVVVARDHVVDPVRIAVRVDQADDRDPQALRLAHGDRLGLEVDHEQRVRDALHVLDAAEVRAQLLEVGLRGQALARRQQAELALRLVALEVVQPLDAQRDRLEVREQAAEPAVVHVRLAGRLGDLLDAVAGLLLGADEQHGAAAPGEAVGEALRLAEQLLGARQVDDVVAGALAVDEAAHLRIPPARLVAEVHTGLQQLLDPDFLSHGYVSLCGRVMRFPGEEGVRNPARGAPGRGRSLRVGLGRPGSMGQVESHLGRGGTSPV